MQYTKEIIAALLVNNDKAVYRALIVLFERQTADERDAGETNHLNGMGFNGRDANFGTSLAKQVIRWQDGLTNYAHPLTMPQMQAARKMLRKYAGQLAKVANEKAAVAV
jgi:hypothetical protein